MLMGTVGSSLLPPSLMGTGLPLLFLSGLLSYDIGLLRDSMASPMCLPGDV